MPRLDALLARNLGWSRTAVRVALEAGRVRAADGTVLDDARAEVQIDRLPFDAVVDGVPTRLHDVVDLMLHKPKGCVTALRDARHPTAYALLRDAPLYAELRPVGRLDRDSSGLLL